MNVILGPCPCQGCGRMVVWNGLEWQNAKGYHARHECRNSTPVRYTDDDGSSVTSANRMLPAPSYSLTLLGGVAASRGQD